jgi:hypothetical protein
MALVMLYGERPKGPSYNDIRSMGMGNTTVAVTTDRTAIFHNPAGLSLLREYIDISISPLAASVDGDFITLVRAMADNKSKLSNLSNIDADFINTINQFDGKWVGFAYLPEVTIAAHNIGFGFYSVLPVQTKIESGHLIPKLGVQGQQDLVFTWAVGVPLKSSKNHCGISVEYLQRTPLNERISGYAETFKLFNEISKGQFFGILGDYTKLKHGVSFDVGFMHDFGGFRLAYDVKDILGIVGGEMVVPRIDLGCAYFFPQLRKYTYIENFIVAMEFSDVIGLEQNQKYEQFFKKIHAGVEFDVKYAALRLGLSQGYPTAGLGVKAGVFRADYVFFTEETGYFAGQAPRKKHFLSVSFNFKVKKDKNADKQDNNSPSENPVSKNRIKDGGTIQENNLSVDKSQGNAADRKTFSVIDEKTLAATDQ